MVRYVVERDAKGRSREDVCRGDSYMAVRYAWSRFRIQGHLDTQLLDLEERPWRVTTRGRRIGGLLIYVAFGVPCGEILVNIDTYSRKYG